MRHYGDHYVARPIKVHAFQWTSKVIYPHWFVEELQAKRVILSMDEAEVYVRNKWGVEKATPGDYIMRDEEGQLHAVKERKFSQWYQKRVEPLPPGGTPV